jgi:putative oxidoreductase
MEIALKPPLLAVGRVLLALIYVLAGIGKIFNTGATASNMGSVGIPYPHVLVYGAIAVELGAGLMLIAGLFARWAAAALFCYTLALALIFHAYWAVAPALARTQHAFFFGHLSMMGGMLFVAVFGAGPWSLDALFRHRGGTLPGDVGHGPTGG